MNDYKEAAKKLLEGGVIAFPTETVMGLGVVFNDFAAYAKLNKIKNRPEDKPYTMMLGNIKDISKYAEYNENTQAIINKFLPGSLTLLLNKKDTVPDYVTHGTNVIGIRVPTNAEAIKLLNEVKVPLLVPSANKSGEKPTVNSDETKNIFKNELDYVVEGVSKGEIPSTIVDFTDNKPKLVRKGPIEFEAILQEWRKRK